LYNADIAVCKTAFVAAQLCPAVNDDSYRTTNRRFRSQLVNSSRTAIYYFSPYCYYD